MLPYCLLCDGESWLLTGVQGIELHTLYFQSKYSYIFPALVSICIYCITAIEYLSQAAVYRKKVYSVHNCGG